MHVLIAGSNGLVGSHLVRRLIRDGHRVTTLVRGESGPVSEVTKVSWDPDGDSLDLSSSVAGNIDAVIHLGGAPIAGKRWNPQNKALIRNSRVHSTRLLARATAALEKKPRVMVVASAKGIYGERGDDVLTESSEPGSGFLAETAVDWECSADPAREAGIRVVNARFGHILARDGGMVPRLKIPYQTGLGGPIGSGRQWWPWIALEDVSRAIRFCIDNDSISGPVNVCAPDSSRQKDFAKAFASALNRPAFFPLPGWVLRLLIGELATDLLSSQRMVPDVLEKSGFEWLGADLQTVFHHIFRAPAESEWR